MAKPEMKPPSKPKSRISAKLREAVRLMTEGARTRAQASEITGIKEDTLYRAMKRTEVQDLRNAFLRGLRESEAGRSIKRVADLADGSKSDAVKLDANEILLGLAGEGPVTKGEIAHIHSGTVPGLTITFQDYRYPSPAIIEQAPQPRVTAANAIPRPIPHPSQRPK
jgi:hypothetical protein